VYSRRQFCGNLEVCRPLEPLWNPRLREAATTLVATRGQRVAKTRQDLQSRKSRTKLKVAPVTYRDIKMKKVKEFMDSYFQDIIRKLEKKEFNTADVVSTINQKKEWQEEYIKLSNEYGSYNKLNAQIGRYLANNQKKMGICKDGDKEVSISITGRRSPNQKWKVLLIPLLLLFVNIFSYAQTLTPQQNSKSKWGYVNETGKAVIKHKKGVLEIAEKGTEIQKPEDIIKDHFVFEFLGIQQQEKYLEGEVEEKLIQNLEHFLLELGKGFAFVKRQYRVPVGTRKFSVDLVFYHIILKCYVLIDLKRGEVEHGDIGQMNFYLNYFRNEVNTETDNEPIGIVLGAYKDRIVVKYAIDNINNHLFVSKYQLYLPAKEDLERELNKLLENNESN